jgi:hypothetical protein
VRSQVNKGNAGGTVSIARSIWKADGAAGFFRGIGALWARDIPFNFVFMGAYETCNAIQAAMFGVQDKSDLGALSVFMSGGLAGMCGWAAIFPAGERRLYASFALNGG